VSKSSASRKQSYAFYVLPIVAVVAIGLIVLTPAQRWQAHGTSPHSLVSAVSPSKAIVPAAQDRLRASYAALPLAFEQNVGQTDSQVQYMARANGYKLYLTSGDAVFSFASSSPAAISRPKQLMEQRLLGYSRKTKKVIRRRVQQTSINPSAVASLRMHIVHANASASVEVKDPLPGKVNYFIGRDSSKWHTDVEQFAQVSYKNIYPDIDLIYHGQHRQLEFDFVVKPKANPKSIAIGFGETQHLALDESGNLKLKSPLGDLTLHKPVAYQGENGSRREVNAQFVLEANNQVRFEIGNYDRSRALVIDPSLSYATYIGGNGDDEAYGIAVDGAGNSYITGESSSTSGFPGSNPSLGRYDAFVVKINAAGTLGYTTFVGGSGDDLGSAIAVNSTTGAVYVGGITTSTDIPTVSTAAQPISGSPASSNCTTGSGSLAAPCTDGFVFELNPTGATAYVTYLGGNNDDGAFGVALDGSGNAYVTGFTFSANFPLQSALYSVLNNSVASTPPFEDAFVTEVNPTGTAFVYSTYLGGENNDFGAGIAVDGAGDAFVVGTTSSPDFPFTSNAYQTICGTDGLCNAGNAKIFSDVFISKLSSGGSALSYSTYLGGSSDDSGLAIAVDSSGNIFATGQTTDDNLNLPTDDFPIVGGFESTYGNGNVNAGSNAFVSKLAPLGGGTSDLIYSSYLGGSTADAGLGIAIDQFDNAYITGSTLSTDFPSTGGFQTTLNGNSDAFISQVAANGASLFYSSYLGGTGDEDFDSTSDSFLGGAVALGSSAQVYLSGSTSSSTGFPTAGTPLQPSFGGGPFDAFEATVTANVTPDFSIGAPSTTSVSSPGSSATVAITLTAANGYNSSVALTCAVTGAGSPLPACGSFSPASPVTPTISGAATTLTITTTGSSASLVHPAKFFYAMWLPVTVLSLVGMAFSSARSRRKKLLGFLMVFVVMAALFLMPACGGGSSSGGGGGGGGGGSTCSGCTPAGSYTVTVTGTGSDTASTTHTATVTLTVN
jgi:hypothetical protein